MLAPKTSKKIIEHNSIILRKSYSNFKNLFLKSLKDKYTKKCNEKKKIVNESRKAITKMQEKNVKKGSYSCIMKYSSLLGSYLFTTKLVIYYETCCLI